MTRDAEHTPSPQSVVSLERAEYERLIGVAEDLISNTEDPGTEALAAVYCARGILSAAPAPSSLAGGADIDALDQELIDRGLRTVRAYDAVRFLREALSATTTRLTGYDWNADPEGLTKQQGDAFALADKVFSDLSAAVDAHPDSELLECQSCGGAGKIEEAARTAGANQHSACVRICDDCDGCGFAPDEEPSTILAALSPEAPAREGVDLHAIAKDAAERVHKNGGCVPRMAYAPILFALQDALTPRHEAPAELLSNPQELIDPAAFNAGVKAWREHAEVSDKDPVPSEWTGQGTDDDFFKPAKTAFSKEAPADCPKCGGTHTRDRIDHGCGGPPVPSNPPSHGMRG